jgi:hypothetical protein
LRRQFGRDDASAASTSSLSKPSFSQVQHGSFGTML